MCVSEPLPAVFSVLFLAKRCSRVYRYPCTLTPVQHCRRLHGKRPRAASRPQAQGLSRVHRQTAAGHMPALLLRQVRPSCVYAVAWCRQQPRPQHRLAAAEAEGFRGPSRHTELSRPGLFFSGCRALCPLFSDKHRMWGTPTPWGCRRHWRRGPHVPNCPQNCRCMFRILRRTLRWGAVPWLDAPSSAAPATFFGSVSALFPTHAHVKRCCAALGTERPPLGPLTAAQTHVSQRADAGRFSTSFRFPPHSCPPKGPRRPAHRAV